MAHNTLYNLPNGHMQSWELDHKKVEHWRIRCLWAVVLEKAPESSLDSKEIKPVNLKGNQPWILIGRPDAGAETPVFWLSDTNSWLIGKVPDSGKDWGQKEKRGTTNEMAGWHHWSNGHKRANFGRHWGLQCCSPRGDKKLETTGELSNNDVVWFWITICVSSSSFTIAWHDTEDRSKRE